MEIRIDTSGTKRNISLFGSFQYGSVMRTNDFMKGQNSLNEPVKPYRAAVAGISVQTTGNELWEQLYNYPSYGVGFYKPVFPNAPYLGNPFAFYGVVSFPMRRTPLATYSFDMGFGIAFNWRSHREDRYNIALGSSESIIFMPSFSAERRIADKLMLSLGAGFAHFPMAR
ncbi:MAG: hypothetical protein LBV26_06270 [Bacteroidales bacterium]|nr:hypothetical protein [Bacteroidales bacterium]